MRVINGHEYYTTSEMATLLAVSIGTINRWIRTKQLRAVSLMKRNFIARSEADRFMASAGFVGEGGGA